VFRQEKPCSCVQAASRQVIRAKTGENVPEGDLRLESQNHPGSYDPAAGTQPENIAPVLRENGVNDASFKQNQNLDHLADATRNGDPAVVGLRNDDGSGHAVTVERVTTRPDGTREVTVADPAQGRVVMPEDEFNRRHCGWAVTTNPQTPSP
jgi:hypothetical protein